MKLSQTTLQRVAIGFLILAAYDLIVGQKMLAMICGGIAIGLGLSAGWLTGGSSKTGKRR